MTKIAAKITLRAMHLLRGVGSLDVAAYLSDVLASDWVKMREPPQPIYQYATHRHRPLATPADARVMVSGPLTGPFTLPTLIRQEVLNPLSLSPSKQRNTSVC